MKTYLKKVRLSIGVLLLLGSFQSGFAQSIPLSTGEVLTVTSQDGNSVYLKEDNQSFVSVGKNGLLYASESGYPSGETGGAAGVINLITSGYNAFAFDHYSVDSGYTAVLPLTPTQRATQTPLFTQSYTYPTTVSYLIPKKGVPFTVVNEGKEGIFYLLLTSTNAYTLYSNQTGFISWFHTGASSSTPTAPFTVLPAHTSVLVYYGNQLHFINLDTNVDTLVSIPDGWAGDVAIVSMSEQGPNGDDGYQVTSNYENATITGGPSKAPTGSLSVDKNMVGQNGSVTLNWSVTPSN